VVRRVSESFDGPAVDQTERFAESQTGRRVHEAASAPYSWFSRLGYRIFGGPDPESPERVTLARKLDELTVSSKTAIELYMRVYEAIVRWYEAIDRKSAAIQRCAGARADPRSRLCRTKMRLDTAHSDPFQEISSRVSYPGIGVLEIT
jgi:hypothetical protein